MASLGLLDLDRLRELLWNNEHHYGAFTGCNSCVHVPQRPNEKKAKANSRWMLFDAHIVCSSNLSTGM